MSLPRCDVAVTALLPARPESARRSSASCACGSPAIRGRRRSTRCPGSPRWRRSRRVAGIGDLGECRAARVGRRRGDGQHEGRIRRGGGADQQRGRAAHVRQRHPAKRRPLAQRRGREVDACAAARPAAARSDGSPVTKSMAGTWRSLPSSACRVQTPSSDVASEIIGPAGRDMQMLPPTVAVFQILNEARKARQHSSIRNDAGQSGRPGKA